MGKKKVLIEMDETEYQKYLSLKGTKTSREILLGSLGIETERLNSGPRSFKFGHDESRVTVESRRAIEEQIDEFRRQNDEWVNNEMRGAYEGDAVIICKNRGERYKTKSKSGQTSRCPRCGQVNETSRVEPEPKTESTIINPPESFVLPESEARQENTSYTTQEGGQTEEPRDHHTNKALAPENTRSCGDGRSTSNTPHRLWAQKSGGRVGNTLVL